MAIITLEKLSVTYDGEREAVSQVSMCVEPGQIVSLVGESGSGKSTLIHAILGLLPQNIPVPSGKVTLLGKDVWADRGKCLKGIRGSQASMIFQDAGRYLNPTARIGKQYKEFLQSHGSYSEETWRHLACDMLTRMHLQDAQRVLRAYPFELSGGMCQRVAIAMAMSLQPKILLADEPTSALDVTIQAQVVRQMMELRENYGTAILMVTHNMGVAAYMSDYIGVMQQGRLIEWNTAQELVTHPKEEYTKSLLRCVIELGDKRFAEE